MTPEAAANRRSKRRLIAAVVLIVIALGLDVVGIDLLTLPLMLAGATCGMTSQYWQGWAHGHRARNRKEAE